MRSSAPWRGCPFESLTTPRSVATESAYRCGETNHDTATIRNIRARVVMAQKYRFSGFCKTDRGRGPGVPAEGLEPTRSCDHWILSPARLPIPPRRRENVKLRNQRRSSSGSDVLNRDAYQEIRPFRLYVIAEIRTRLLVTQIGSSNILVQ